MISPAGTGIFYSGKVMTLNREGFDGCPLKIGSPLFRVGASGCFQAGGQKRVLSDRNAGQDFGIDYSLDFYCKS